MPHGSVWSAMDARWTMASLTPEVVMTQKELEKMLKRANKEIEFLKTFHEAVELLNIISTELYMGKELSPPTLQRLHNFVGFDDSE
jgi:hypothetical protein